MLNDVAIVGAGTGNDVAAALRAKPGHVDAIEIDPVILQVGEERHPEKPYQDPRVRVVNNDARTFLRNTSNTYDLIVYGLLDSHTLLSQGSSVRLELFRLYDRGPARGARPIEAGWHAGAVLHRAVGRAGAKDLPDAPGCLRRPRAAIARVVRRQHHLPGLERSQLEAAGQRDHLELRGHHRQLRALDGGSDRLDRRLAVLLYAAAHLSDLVSDHDRVNPAAVAASGREFRRRSAALQPSVVLLPRLRLHAGRDQRHHRNGADLRQHLAGDRHRLCRHPDHGVHRQLPGAVAQHPPPASRLSVPAGGARRRLARRALRWLCLDAARAARDRRLVKPAAVVLRHRVLDASRSAQPDFRASWR